MDRRKQFIKDLKDYLVDGTEYDFKRITEIYDRYCFPDKTPKVERVYVTKIEKVYITASGGTGNANNGKILYPEISRDDIIDICSSVFGISKEDIFYKRWNKSRALCRHCMCYFIYLHTPLTLKQVGRIFSRDHTTVMNSRDIIIDIIDTEQDYGYSHVMTIKEELYKLIKQRKDAKRNTERIDSESDIEPIISGNTQSKQGQGILRRAI